MIRMIRLLLIVSSLLFLVSCNKNDLDRIAKEGDWERVLQLSDEIISSKGLEKEALYYNAISLYYTGNYVKAVDSSRLYVLMYDDNNPVILKILLYKGVK